MNSDMRVWRVQSTNNRGGYIKLDIFGSVFSRYSDVIQHINKKWKGSPNLELVEYELVEVKRTNVNNL